MRLTLSALVESLGSLLFQRKPTSAINMSDREQQQAESGQQHENQQEDDQRNQDMEMSEANDKAEEEEVNAYMREHVRQEKIELFMKHSSYLKKIITVSFEGVGKPDELKSDWAMFKANFNRTCATIGIPEEQRGDHVSNLLDGPALKLFLQRSPTTFEEIDKLFSTSAFQPSVTDYSVRCGWYDDPSMKAETAAAVRPIIRRIERDASKAPTAPTDIEKIVVLQRALPASLRSMLMLNELNEPYTSWDLFMAAVMAHVNSQQTRGRDRERGNGSSSSSAPRPPTPNTRKRSQSFEQRRVSVEQPRQQQQHQQQGINGGQPGTSNAEREHPPCKGCGSRTHQVYWKDRQGNPICPNYDAKKDKRQAFPKRA